MGHERAREEKLTLRSMAVAQERVVADMNTRGSGVVSAVPSTLKATSSSSGSSSSGASAAAAAPVLPSAGPLYTVEDVSKLVEELQRLH
jgi:hypothetical protein